MTRRDLAAAAGAEIRRTVRHQRYRGQRVRDQLGLSGEPRPFGPTVNILDFGGERSFGGCSATAHELSTGPVDDIEFIARETPAGELAVNINANPALYRQDELATHTARFVTFLADLAALGPDEPSPGSTSVPRPGIRPARATE